MSEQTPYEQLGVTENSSFEEIQAAKKRISEENSNDAKVVEQIEAAYDAVIMDRLRLRQEGKIKVPERIRFPERKVESPVSNPPTVKSSPSWMQTLIDSPTQREVLVPSGVFVALSTVILVVSSAASLLPLLMSLGFMATVYFINAKEKRFARSLLIALLMLIAGVTLGTTLANSLAITPQPEIIGSGIDSGAAADSMANIGYGVNAVADRFAAVVTFILFWVASCFFK